MRIAFFATMLLFTCAAHAQQRSPAARRNLGERVIAPGQPQYPVELANSGVQGTTVIEGTIEADGKLSGMTVAKSSRSDVLDKNALLVVEGWRLKDAPAVPQQFSIAIGFMKDSLANLKDKPCADFIADLDYFTRTFPELPAKKMALISSTGGLLILAKPDAYRSYAKQEDAVIDSTVDQCRKNPADKYLATFFKAIP